MRENYAQLQKDKQRLEAEHDESIAEVKKECASELDTMRQKLQSAENSQKETQR